LDQQAPFTARSHPSVVALLVLGAATVFFLYVGLSAFDRSLPVVGPRRLARPSQDVGIFLLVLAAISLAATVWQIRRRLVSNVDVVADAEGISSHQSFYGRGRLAWSEITKLEIKYGSLLYVHGVPQGGSGKAKRLVIDTAQIDEPAIELFGAIARYRPDLAGALPSH
jgi:hypothetical protein